jgi:GGDEF domain-containing protein
MVAIARNGAIISASSDFWSLLRIKSPVAHLSHLLSQTGNLFGSPAGGLVAALAKLIDATGGEGLTPYAGEEGEFRLMWRRLPGNNPITVVCLVPENNAGADSPAPISGAATTVDRELPNPAITLNLLSRALAACRKSRSSLCIARISLSAANNLPLRQQNPEVWRGVGRRLRQACRLSDLVGTTAEGDFVIILINTKRADTRAVTERILAQLQEWLQANYTAPYQIAVGHAAWAPGAGAATAERMLAEAATDRQPVTVS